MQILGMCSTHESIISPFVPFPFGLILCSFVIFDCISSLMKYLPFFALIWFVTLVHGNDSRKGLVHLVRLLMPGSQCLVQQFYIEHISKYYLVLINSFIFYYLHVISILYYFNQLNVENEVRSLVTFKKCFYSITLFIALWLMRTSIFLFMMTFSCLLDNIIYQKA